VLLMLADDCSQFCNLVGMLTVDIPFIKEVGDQVVREGLLSGLL